MNLAIFTLLFNKGFISAQIVHARGNQLVPELLLKLSDTVHIQYRYIEHVHKEVSSKKLLFSKMAAYLTLQFCMTCIDSAYVGNSTCITACAETIQYFAYTI